jgi:hypothetical protein
VIFLIAKVKATPKFMKLAKHIMLPDMLQKLIDTLALSPEKGVIIKGTGGVRKIRWRTGKDNKGKSGGVRVLYYYDKNTVIVLLVTLFKKSDIENIDNTEKTQLKKLVPELLRGCTNE